MNTTQRTLSWLHLPLVTAVLSLLLSSVALAEPQPQNIKPSHQTAIPLQKSTRPAAVAKKQQVAPVVSKKQQPATPGQSAQPKKDTERQVVISQKNKKALDSFAKTMASAPVPQGKGRGVSPATAYSAQQREGATVINRFGVPVQVVIAADKQERPPHQEPLPGDEQTLSQMDKTEKPEIILRHQMNKKAAATLSVNENNRNSPLYVPEEKNTRLNSTGVGMDVQVEEDVKLRVGAEYRSHGNMYSSGDKESQGASVGLTYSF